MRKCSRHHGYELLKELRWFRHLKGPTLVIRRKLLKDSDIFLDLFMFRPPQVLVVLRWWWSWRRRGRWWWSRFVVVIGGGSGIGRHSSRRRRGCLRPKLNGFKIWKVFQKPGNVTNLMVNLNCCQHIQLQTQIRPYFLVLLTMFFSLGGRSSCRPRSPGRSSTHWW